jgi:hypothetical protein
MITLPEELLLLAVEDDGRIAYTAGLPGFGLAIIGACLAEMSVGGRLDADLSGVRVVSTTPTGIAAQDLVLEALAKGPGRSISDWILELQPRGPELVAATLGILTQRGILAQQDQRFLWVLKARRYPMKDGREQREAKLRIMELLLSEELPSTADTVLLGFAAAAQLLQGFLSSAEIARLEHRIQQVGGLDLFVRGTEEAIRADAEIRARAFMTPLF